MPDLLLAFLLALAAVSSLLYSLEDRHNILIFLFSCDIVPTYLALCLYRKSPGPCSDSYPGRDRLQEKPSRVYVPDSVGFI